MNKKPLILLLLVFVFQNILAINELQVRSGLSCVSKRIEQGKNTSIGFLGGSITQAENGWRSRTMNWFRQTYPAINFREVNAAIGGTNSKYGAYRVESHLLDSAQFDLIFVEFSVNDLTLTKTDTLECYRSMEGIIRKIKKQQPRADICLIYTISEPAFEAVKKGKYNQPTSIHERLAAYYNISSVFFGLEVLKAVNNGDVVFQDKISDYATEKNADGKFIFAQDGVHPGNFGHGLYENVMKRSLPILLKQTNFPKQKYPKAFVANNHERAKLYPPVLKNQHGMTLLNAQQLTDSMLFMKPFLKANKQFIYASDSRQYYAFTFNGNELGISCLYGFPTGKVIVEVDGIPHEYSAFDRFCVFNRINFIFHGCENGLHKVKIYPSNQMSYNEKKAIIGESDFKDNPLYTKNYLIISEVLINGKMK